jgi:DNA repair exonuclease SbcCD ATPase subunit
MSRIIQLTSENVKKLKLVRITPQGNMVTITGKNGSGKTSVLDSISLALEGTEGAPSQIIRAGQKRAGIDLDMGDFTVSRTFTDTGTNLVIKGKDGQRYPTPQKLLDGLMSRLGFDPFVFMRLKPKDQVDALRQLIKFDTDELDGENEADFDSRTQARRDLKAAEVQLAAIEPALPDLPEKLIDVTEVANRLQTAITHNAAVEAAEQQIGSLVREAEIAESNANARHAQIQQLMQQIKESEAAEAKHREQAEAYRTKARDLKVHERIDTQQFAEEIKNAEATNAQIKKRDQRQELEAQRKDLINQVEQLTANIGRREEEKREAISKAKLPIRGLSFSGSEVVFGGFPLNQASSSDQLRVSIAIAMAANPKLKVIRISDGSLLDEDSLALISQMADEGDYQIWIERVDTSGKVGIVMEDGEVAADHSQRKPPAKAAKKAAHR